MSAPPRTSTASRTPGARTSRPASRPAARRSRLVDEQPAAAASSGLSDVVVGVLAAGQALVLSLAVVVLPAVVAYLVGTAAQGAPSGAADDAVHVRSAVDVAMGIWLLGHGVPLTTGEVTLSLAPLGITALALFAVYVSAKRFAATSVRAWVAGAVTYALCTAAVAAFAGSAPGWSLPVAAVAGLVVGGLGTGLGILARPDAPAPAEIGERTEALALRLTGLDLVPPTFRLGLRAGAVVTAALVGGAALLVVAWAVAGRATSSDIITALEPGWAGGVVFAVAQLALLPNLVLWAVSWLAGPGFAIGAGTSFTPYGTVSGPLPAIPLLGALPGADWANAVSAWSPVLVVACGVVAGLFAWRRLEPSLVRWPDVGWVLAGTVLTPGVLMLLGQWVAAGAGGPGRLAVIGAQPLVTAGLVSAEVAGGAAAVLLGAKLDVVSRRGEIGEDLVTWLRRPAPVRSDGGEDGPDAGRDGLDVEGLDVEGLDVEGLDTADAAGPGGGERAPGRPAPDLAAELGPEASPDEPEPVGGEVLGDPGRAWDVSREPGAHVDLGAAEDSGGASGAHPGK
ncbi:DUF6350 family protein [Promicromonospora sp. NPDC050880]|uniref:cell division protein PerM n=1 Tax=Promicromonospora sp. NPDC050880 TaxID=3364406 RepID=UPI00378C4F88